MFIWITLVDTQVANNAGPQWASYPWPWVSLELASCWGGGWILGNVSLSEAQQALSTDIGRWAAQRGKRHPNTGPIIWLEDETTTWVMIGRSVTHLLRDPGNIIETPAQLWLNDGSTSQTLTRHSASVGPESRWDIIVTWIPWERHVAEICHSRMRAAADIALSVCVCSLRLHVQPRTPANTTHWNNVCFVLCRVCWVRVMGVLQWSEKTKPSNCLLFKSAFQVSSYCLLAFQIP